MTGIIPLKFYADRTLYGKDAKDQELVIYKIASFWGLQGNQLECYRLISRNNRDYQVLHLGQKFPFTLYKDKNCTKVEEI